MKGNNMLCPQLNANKSKHLDVTHTATEVSGSATLEGKEALPSIVANFSLNQAKALNDKIIASERENVQMVETNGGIRITLNAGLFEVVKTLLPLYYEDAESFKANSRLRRDKNGYIIDITMSVYHRASNKKAYVIAIYNTTSQMLVNGKDHHLFYEHFDAILQKADPSAVSHVNHAVQNLRKSTRERKPTQKMRDLQTSTNGSRQEQSALNKNRGRPRKSPPVPIPSIGTLVPVTTVENDAEAPSPRVVSTHGKESVHALGYKATSPKQANAKHMSVVSHEASPSTENASLEPHIPGADMSPSVEPPITMDDPMVGCAICLHSAADEAVQCDMCDQWIHYKCAKISAHWRVLLEETNSPYTCAPCALIVDCEPPEQNDQRQPDRSENVKVNATGDEGPSTSHNPTSNNCQTAATDMCCTDIVECNTISYIDNHSMEQQSSMIRRERGNQKKKRSDPHEMDSQPSGHKQCNCGDSEGETKKIKAAERKLKQRERTLELREEEVYNVTQQTSLLKATINRLELRINDLEQQNNELKLKLLASNDTRHSQHTPAYPSGPIKDTGNTLTTTLLSLLVVLLAQKNTSAPVHCTNDCNCLQTRAGRLCNLPKYEHHCCCNMDYDRNRSSHRYYGYSHPWAQRYPTTNESTSPPARHIYEYNHVSAHSSIPRMPPSDHSKSKVHRAGISSNAKPRTKPRVWHIGMTSADDNTDYADTHCPSMKPSNPADNQNILPGGPPGRPDSKTEASTAYPEAPGEEHVTETESPTSHNDPPTRSALPKETTDPGTSLAGQHEAGQESFLECSLAPKTPDKLE
jgi:hypothetical protein